MNYVDTFVIFLVSCILVLVVSPDKVNIVCCFGYFCDDGKISCKSC